ncbi:hypothetical protein GCM10020221_14450 [Streptomyces thioluteus]|uniref:Uncharacterized protein n=1 Tax=Streptomyces thioluteus TaxID=66431 RepID=A0ABN3WKR0_STRTU
MPLRKSDLQPELLDPLLHDEGAVARVVAVDLVRMGALLQAPHVVLDLADRAAGVVHPGGDVDRGAHVVYVGQR